MYCKLYCTKRKKKGYLSNKSLKFLVILNTLTYSLSFLDLLRLLKINLEESRCTLTTLLDLKLPAPHPRRHLTSSDVRKLNPLGIWLSSTYPKALQYLEIFTKNSS